MRRLLVLLALFITTQAYATDLNDICFGLPIRDSNRIFANDGRVLGVDPANIEDTTCGGGISSEGERIPKFHCLVQRWVFKNDINVLVVFEKKSSTWVVVDMRICGKTINDCHTPALNPCKQSKATSF